MSKKESSKRQDSRSNLWVVLHDLHWPKTNKECFVAAMDFIHSNEVAGVVLGGDQLDFECIAHHTKGKGLYRLPGSYERDVAGFEKHVLQPLEKECKQAKRVWIIGNHERFEQDLVEEQPELQDTVNHVRRLRLEERGWEVVPLGHCYKLGRLNVIHGETLTGIGNQAGMYPSRKAVELYGANVLAGHTHAPQSFARVSPVEHVQKHMGVIAPCMCNTNPSYLRNRPTNWLNGFTIVETGANGLFNLYTVIVNNGVFYFGGKKYGC